MFQQHAQPLWGYKSLVYSVLAIGFLILHRLGHHMYRRNGHQNLRVLQDDNDIISIPSVIIGTCLFLSLLGGSSFQHAMLFALAFCVFARCSDRGVGLPLGFAAADLTLHDTYTFIAHFHLRSWRREQSSA